MFATLDIISTFKEATRAEFSDYQASKLYPTKYHTLDHLVDDPRVMGDVQYPHGGIFKMSHKHLRQDYSLKSKRSSTAMEEKISIQEYRTLPCTTKTEYDTLGRSNTSRARKAKEYGTCLMRTSQTITLFQLEEAHEEMFKSTRNEE